MWSSGNHDRNEDDNTHKKIVQECSGNDNIYLVWECSRNSNVWPRNGVTVKRHYIRNAAGMTGNRVGMIANRDKTD